MKKNGKKPNNNLKILSGVIGILLCVAFIPLLIFNMVLIIKGFAKPDEVPAVFHLCPLIESNDAMTSSRTSIKNGDLLFFKNDVTDYKLGYEDGTIVAIMTEKDNIVVRRLAESSVNAEGQVVYTAVTEANAEGTQVTAVAEQIVGVYAFRLAKMGDVVLFSRRPLGTFLLVVLPMFLLFMLIYALIISDKRSAEAAHEKTAALKKAQAATAPRYYFDDDEEIIVGEYEVFVDADGKQSVKRIR